jgi:hypothetical protein
MTLAAKMYINLRFTKKIIQCWPVVIVVFFDTHVAVAIFFVLCFILHFFSYRPIPLAAGLGRSQGEEQGQGLRPQEVRLGPQQGKEFNIRIRI